MTAPQSPRATLLAIETSTEACSVALYVHGEVISRHELAPRRHTQLVLPWADELMARADDALYASKREGRDRVSVHAPTP